METIEEIEATVTQYKQDRDNLKRIERSTDLLDKLIYRLELIVLLKRNTLYSLEQIKEWWFNTPVIAFGGKTPNDLILKGDYKSLDKMIHTLNLK